MLAYDEFYRVFMASSPRAFIHVDWSGALEAKTFVNRTKLACPSNPAIDVFAADLDLASLTYFGEKHLWGDRFEWATACRELACEWIRRERYKHEISRFHCLFGFEAMAEAERFVEIHKITSPAMWRVLAIDFSDRKDMNWFDRVGTLMDKLFDVDRYWKGEPANDSPCWEILLHPSVYIDERLR